MAFFKTWDDRNGFLWIKRLLWTYIGVFIINETLSVWFGGSPLDAVFSLKNGTSLLWQPWRLLSYSFLHGDLLHLLFNLLMWYGLSNFLLQNTLSLRQFLILYASGIIVGGLAWWIIHCNHHPQALVGASAGISALFVYFCLLYPDKSLSILLYFIIPVRIQARWCFIALTVYELYGVLFYELLGLTNIAHSGHLGGILIGWLFIWYRRHPNVFHFRRPSGSGKVSYRVHRESYVKKRMKFVGLAMLFLCLRMMTGSASCGVDGFGGDLTASKLTETCRNFVSPFLEISKEALPTVPVKTDAGKETQTPSPDVPETLPPGKGKNKADPTVEASKSPLLLQAPKPLEATALMRVETLFFVQMLEQFHISKKKLSDLPTEEVLRSYVSALDGQKMIFTQTQVDWFVKEYRGSFELLWRAGSLTPGFMLADLYRRRFRERVQWIQRRLEQPFDFSSNATFIDDRKDAAFAPDTASLDALWERRLQHELINEAASRRREDADVLSEEGELSLKKTEEGIVTEATVAENETKARERLKEWYGNLNNAVQSLEPSDIQELYCDSLSQFYDPHTNFLSADTMEDFAIELRNALTGIGAVLREERGNCIISELTPGGPAERCGRLQAGDKILAVAQGKEAFVNIQGLRLRRSVKMIRGKKGTVVRLLIQPADGDPSQRKTVELVRDEIKLEDKLAFAKVFTVPDACGIYHTIGWIDVPSFYGADEDKNTKTHTVSEDVRTLIERLKRFPIEGIILDMRRNGGGLLTEAVKLVGLFLNNASVVQVRGSDLNNCLYADADGCVWDGPLLVLTSRFSASAAEIAAGALQVMRRALLFGAPATHGKGSVQAMIEMDKLSLLSGHSPLGAAKLTIQKWYLPDGSSIQRRGVRPDIVKTSLSDCLPVSESDSPHALQWDCIEPMPPKVPPSLSGRWLRSGVLQLLLQRQHAREAKQSYFDWHQRQAELFAKRYKQTEYSLNLKDRIVRINEERRLSKTLADEEKTFLPLRYGYRLLTLGDAPHKSGKTKKPMFDFFEREALDIMTDWVVALHIVPQFSLWCYAKKRLF